MTSTPNAAATATPAPYPPDTDRHFQIASWLPLISHNPHVGFGGRSWLGARLVLEPLFEFDAGLNPVLLLSSEWPTFDNGLLDAHGRWVTWKLREGVIWHDGQPFTAADVIATWRFAADPDGTAEGTRTTGNSFALVNTIERIDDHTVTIHFSQSNPNWFDTFRGGDGVILPAHIFEPLIGKFTSYEDEVNQAPVGTGHWKIVESNLSKHQARYERFEGYWDETRQAFDTVELQFLTGDPMSNAMRVLETGDADYAPGLQMLSGEQLQGIGESDTGRLPVIPGLGIETLFLNFTDPRGREGQPRAEPGNPHRYFANLTVRQAVSLAIPRDRLAEAYGDIANEPFVYPIVAPEAYRGTGSMTGHNLDLARTMLDGIGFNGGSLLLQTSVDPSRQLAQEIIAKRWRGSDSRSN
ncbi:MAG: ABC transporter substrate-binding protein [Thermomicrobiales bacterium]